MRFIEGTISSIKDVYLWIREQGITILVNQAVPISNKLGPANVSVSFGEVQRIQLT